jgi:hypothetical protein
MRVPNRWLLAVLLGAAFLGGCADVPGSPDPPAVVEPRPDLLNPTPLPRSVRFIWFVPSDVAYDSATVRAIGRAAYNTRSWYRAQLGGRTFRFDEEHPVEVVFGRRTRAWYERQPNPFGWDPVWNANYQVDMEVKERLSLEDWSSLYKVAIYMSATGGGGASMGRLVIPQHDVDGIQDGTLNIHRFWGGLAHEMGHTFDLPDATHDDGTIMSGAMYAYPATIFNSTQANAMFQSSRNAGFFPDPGLEFDPGADYRLVNAGTGLAAEAPEVGGAVVAHPPAALARQHWRLEAGGGGGGGGTWRIRNRATGLVLVVEGRSPAPGAFLVQRPAGDPEETGWYVLATGPAEYEVVAAHAIVPNQRARALSLPAGAAAGVRLVQEDYVTAAGQAWRLERVE